MANRNLFFIFIAGSLWGLNTSLAALATKGGYSSFEIAFYQAVLAFVLLQMAGYLMGERVKFSKGLLWSALACGALGLTLPNVLFYSAASEVPAGILSLCIATIPAFTGVIAYFLGIDTLSPRRVIAIGVGILAILILILPGFEGPSIPLNFGYVGMALLAAFFYALSFIIMSYFLRDCDFPLCFTSLIFGVSAVMLFPVTFDVDIVTRLDWNAATLGLVAVGPFIAIAHSFYVFALKSGGAVQASFATIIATTMGVLWGMIVLGEKNTINVWISLIMILGALNVLRKSTEEPQANRDVATTRTSFEEGANT